jgi:hypothetical protein
MGSDVSRDYRRDRGLEVRLARVRRYGSHRVKVSLKNRVRSGFSVSMVLGLLKLDRGLRLALGGRPLSTVRGTRAYSNLVLSLFWHSPTQGQPQGFYNTRLGAPAQIWEEWHG